MYVLLFFDLFSRRGFVALTGGVFERKRSILSRFGEVLLVICWCLSENGRHWVRLVNTISNSRSGRHFFWYLPTNFLYLFSVTVAESPFHRFFSLSGAILEHLGSPVAPVCATFASLCATCAVVPFFIDFSMTRVPQMVSRRQGGQTLWGDVNIAIWL